MAATSQAGGPYKVLNRAKAGGEGSWDYIYADSAERRLYVPRRRSSKDPAEASVAERLEIFNLDTLEPAGRIDGVGGHGVAVDPASQHGFSSSKPVSLFDTKSMKLLKTIDVGSASPDGIVFDSFNQRVYVFSHPTRDATVIDAKDGTVVGTIDLGGTPEQGVPDNNGKLYVVMQDQPGSITVVDVKTMKATAHYPLGSNGGCNGLALDKKNGILFAACARAGDASAPEAMPVMVILRAADGQILTRLPLGGSSDGAVFNPSTLEAFSTGGNGTLTVIKEDGPAAFTVEQNLVTMDGARTIAFDPKTNRVFTMADERGPAPSAPATAGGRPPRGAAVPGSFTLLMIGR